MMDATTVRYARAIAGGSLILPRLVASLGHTGSEPVRKNRGPNSPVTVQKSQLSRTPRESQREAATNPRDRPTANRRIRLWAKTL